MVVISFNMAVLFYTIPCVCVPIFFPLISFINSNQIVTSSNVSNLVNSQRKQNNCMDIDELIMSKHIVNIIRLPSFFPGPKILYTNPSSSGDALISLTIRRT